MGRSRELALLEQTLVGAARGGASRLLLVGEAEIAKQPTAGAVLVCRLDGAARVREDRAVRELNPTSWRRVCVVGSGGAGKSQLARRLGIRLQLPVVHLDQEYWHPGWVKTPEDRWRAHVSELASRPRWIMDGNYGSTFDLRFPTSDAVIFLDMPRRVTLPRVAYRRLANRGRSRSDMTPGCPERLSLEFLAWLWRYPDQSRPIVMQALKDHAEHATVVHLRSPRAVTDWWRSINRAGSGHEPLQGA